MKLRRRRGGAVPTKRGRTEVGGGERFDTESCQRRTGPACTSSAQLVGCMSYRMSERQRERERADGDRGERGSGEDHLREHAVAAMHKGKREGVLAISTRLVIGRSSEVAARRVWDPPPTSQHFTSPVCVPPLVEPLATVYGSYRTLHFLWGVFFLVLSRVSSRSPSFYRVTIA